MLNWMLYIMTYSEDYTVFIFKGGPFDLKNDHIIFNFSQLQYKLKMCNQNSLLNKLSSEAMLSEMRMKHSAIITCGKKRVCVSHNSKRTCYHLGHNKHMNCSTHAEMAVLGRFLSRHLRGRRKKQCVL